jgi:hypothetical protein
MRFVHAIEEFVIINNDSRVASALRFFGKDGSRMVDRFGSMPRSDNETDAQIPAVRGAMQNRANTVIEQAVVQAKRLCL